jgi:hypothetical protein
MNKKERKWKMHLLTFTIFQRLPGMGNNSTYNFFLIGYKISFIYSFLIILTVRHMILK